MPAPDPPKPGEYSEEYKAQLRRTVELRRQQRADAAARRARVGPGPDRGRAAAYSILGDRMQGYHSGGGPPPAIGGGASGLCGKPTRDGTPCRIRLGADGVCQVHG